MSQPTAPPHYFADRKKKLLKNLGVLFTSAGRILPAHVKVSEVPAILDDTRERFGELLAELPNLGGDRNRFNSSIAAGVAALAYIHALESRGVPSPSILESIYRIYFDAYSFLPQLVKAASKWFAFSGIHVRRLQAYARWTQERTYPENYVVEFVPGDGRSFDFGFDVTECALAKFYSRMHAEEHLPHVEVPLLKTKLYIPPARPELVSRPRLIARLNQGLRPGSTLILISALAGYGKSTPLSAWVHQSTVPVAWLSLDTDDDSSRFWTYFVAALQTLDASLARGVERLFDALSLEPSHVQALLVPLLNEVAARPGKIVLVLDDYHESRMRSSTTGSCTCWITNWSNCTWYSLRGRILLYPWFGCAPVATGNSHL